MKEYEDINAFEEPVKDYYEGLTDVERRYVSHGWSRNDLPFLNKVEKMNEFMLFLKDENNISDEKVRKEAEENFKKISEAYYVLHNTYVVSQEVREQTLKSAEEMCKLYDNFAYDTFYKSDLLDAERELLTDYLPKNLNMTRELKETLDKEVSEDEIGLNPVTPIEKKRTVLNMKYNEKTKDKEKPRKEIISNEMEGFDSETLEKNVKIMLNDIYKVDPQWMKSSEKFKLMKESMEKLLQTVHHFNEKMHDGIVVRDYYAEGLKEVKEAIADTKSACKDYLDYKGTQMEKSPNRKNKWMKQFREQPRINTVINCYDKLDYMLDHAVGFEDMKDPMTQFMQDELPAFKDIALKGNQACLDDMQEEMNKNIGNKDAYLVSVARTLVYHRMSRDSYYQPWPGETVAKFSDRVNAVGNEISDDDVKKATRNNSIINKIVLDEKKAYEKGDYKAPTVEELRDKYNKLAKEPHKYRDLTDMKEQKNVRTKETKEMRDKLLSDKNRKPEEPKKGGMKK